MRGVYLSSVRLARLLVFFVHICDASFEMAFLFSPSKVPISLSLSVVEIAASSPPLPNP